MPKSTVARAAARLRQLSCFGLDKEAVIPEMLRELHALIPSFCNSFLFADEKGNLSNVYLENTDTMKLYPLYRQEFREGREREFKGLAFSDVARTQVGAQDFRSTVLVDEKTFRRSDLYNLVLRPSGNDNNFLRVHFRDGRRVLGGLTLWRSVGASDWTVEERRLVNSFAPFFVHALTARAADDISLVDSGELGLIIATAEGKPLYFSAVGRKLLFLATSSENATGMTVGRSAVLPVAITRLCRSLFRIFVDDASDSAPIHHHSNLWGRFTFRAEWLDRDDPGSGLVAITVRHDVPLPVRLTRGAAKLPLSSRQAEISVLMAMGASNDTIASRLGISAHTANQHGRSIYSKLDVHSRAELVRKILSR